MEPMTSATSSSISVTPRHAAVRRLPAKSASIPRRLLPPLEVLLEALGELVLVQRARLCLVPLEAPVDLVLFAEPCRDPVVGHLLQLILEIHHQPEARLVPRLTVPVGQLLDEVVEHQLREVFPFLPLR